MEDNYYLRRRKSKANCHSQAIRRNYHQIDQLPIRRDSRVVVNVLVKVPWQSKKNCRSHEMRVRVDGLIVQI